MNNSKLTLSKGVDGRAVVLAGENIRRIRTDAGLTGAQLAEAADLQPAALMALEAGEHDARLDEIERLARVLKVKLLDLFAPF